MSNPSRRERERQERRETILDAAEQVFFSKGYERSSMDDIARAAELSRGLLYVYFKDKAAIMAGITLRAAEALRDRFAEALTRSKLGMEQIANIGKAYYRFSIEQADYFDALTQAAGFRHPTEEDETLRALERCDQENMELMLTALTNGVRDGSLSPERVRDPLRTAYYLRGALHGVIMQSRLLAQAHISEPEPDTLVRYAIDMMGRSMQP